MFDVTIRHSDETQDDVYDAHDAYDIRSTASGAHILRRTRTQQKRVLLFRDLGRDQAYLRH